MKENFKELVKDLEEVDSNLEKLESKEEEKVTVGEILRKSRLRRNFTVKKVSEITKISQDLIESMEEDDFSKIPAPVYARGFIRNMCEFYGVEDWEHVVSLYEDCLRKSKSEGFKGVSFASELVKQSLGQMEQMTFHRSWWGGTATFFSVIMFLVVVVVIGVMWSFQRQERHVSIAPSGMIKDISVYKMSGERGGFDIREGDEIDILFESSYHKFSLKKHLLKSIMFTLGGSEHFLSEGEKKTIDLNLDQKPDVEVTFQKTSSDLVVLFFTSLGFREKFVDYQKIWLEQERILIGYEKTILSNQERSPIEVYIKSGQLPSHVSYLVDGNRQNATRLQPSGNILITAEESLEITIGNYRSVACLINRIPVNLSMDNDKFSVTKIIRWIPRPDNEKRYDLVVRDYAY